MRGDEVYRVTARKDEWGEVQSYDGKPGWICNTCRFEKKKTNDWNIEGLTTISRHSVIGANKYKVLDMPNETIKKVMHGIDPKLLMNIHNVSEVNNPNVHLSEIEGPAHLKDFNNSGQHIIGDGESRQFGLKPYTSEEQTNKVD
jgi:NADH-quinone oxidoreductase subunit G